MLACSTPFALFVVYCCCCFWAFNRAAQGERKAYFLGGRFSCHLAGLSWALMCIGTLIPNNWAFPAHFPLDIGWDIIVSRKNGLALISLALYLLAAETFHWLAWWALWVFFIHLLLRSLPTSPCAMTPQKSRGFWEGGERERGKGGALWHWSNHSKGVSSCSESGELGVERFINFKH